ncbi:EamA family transporter RarD [Nocardiopsis mangrovi]|uniref:EamA family transporter RarD n=1 Tax=Nocardiopsis mangrovi TaxID=1179818 RepID=A0ABV9E3J5_9ACTN
MWAFSTLYWPLVAAAAPLEILAQRMVWSLAAVLLILAVRRHWRWLTDVLRSPRQLLMLAGAAALISVNWGLFIVAVNSGQATQASLGYFINPLVSVVLGVLVFAERLRPAQWVAVGLGGVAVIVLGFAYGAPPWLALGMASSFATYGVIKKFTRLDGLESLTIETLLMFAPAAAYVVYLEATGAGTLFSVSGTHTALLVATGLVTSVPLLCFGAAARRVPLSMLGLLQFMVPVLQFLFAWLIFDEPLSLSRWIGFAIVWVALVVFAVDMLRTARLNRAASRSAGTGTDARDGAGTAPPAPPTPTSPAAPSPAASPTPSA